MKRCGSLPKWSTPCYGIAIIVYWRNMLLQVETVFCVPLQHMMGEPAFCTLMCSIWNWKNFNKITLDKHNVVKRENS